MCFDPNLQDQEGCTATPIDDLQSPSGKKRRSSSVLGDQLVSMTTEEEELMDQFITKVTPGLDQVNNLVYLTHVLLALFHVPDKVMYA